MSNLNRIVLIGTVQARPETRFGLENNASLSKFTLAVARPPRQDGQVEQDYIPVVAWGRAADYTAENVQASALVVVEGKIQTTQSENNGVRTWQTEVNASTVKTLSGQPAARPESAAPPPDTADNPFASGTKDDIPF
ncbi:MAG: single-stranded DNA-binding protein [Candidatus Margulisbacteria bacterium]|jgi:single-strand DNA-binding protein|nr:single-stranded DNA-binding protein [Candidatus Margulisiibacteriota bacterium]